MSRRRNTHVTGTKAVWAYDEEGNRKLYMSVGLAARDLGIPSSGISRCCQGHYKSTFGYSFEYYDENDLDDGQNSPNWIRKNTNSFRRKRRNVDRGDIIAVELSTNRYRFYDSFSKMCEDLELYERNAYRVLAHEPCYKSVGGYALYYEDEVKISEFDGTF